MKIKTLKSKIILYVLLVTLVPTIFFAVFYYNSTKEIYEKNMLATALDNIYYMKKSIDERILMANGLSDWFFMNRNFDQILTEKNIKDTPEFQQASIHVYKQIELRLINSPFVNYISSVIVLGDNGVEFRYGNDASMMKINDITSSRWFKEGLNKNGMPYWGGIVENPAMINYSDYILPLVRPIIHTSIDKKIGWVFIAFKESLLTEIYLNKNEETLYKYFLLDQLGRGIPYNFTAGLISSLDIKNEITNIINQEVGHFSFEKQNQEMMVVYEKLNHLDWTLVETLSLEGLNKQQSILKKISLVIFISSLIFTAIFIIYLSFNLTKPLKKIKEHMGSISNGNFERNLSIEGEDEMGKLGIKINEMASNIKQLMGKLVEEEQEKRRLELKALQNQINPHFLYNTLNSIKWMATLKKANGIKNMVVALGRLLKNLTSNIEEKVTLEQELSLLKDFIYIQQIRYNGQIKFKIEVENEELLKCKIIKFIIQPIVENSIFHGIDPKKNSGNIQLTIKRDKRSSDLLITIRDDGIGMSEGQINSIFDEHTDNAETSRGLSGIGIQNVNNRLKLTYGQEYGLTIESIEGELTEVLFRIPCELAKKGEGE